MSVVRQKLNYIYIYVYVYIERFTCSLMVSLLTAPTRSLQYKSTELRAFCM